MFTVQAKVLGQWIARHITSDLAEALRVAADTLKYLYDEVRIIDENNAIVISDKEL